MSDAIKLLDTHSAKVAHITLGTVDEAGFPAQRTLAGFAVGGGKVYFSTSAQSRKIKHIKAHPQVSVLLQQDGQELGVFINLVVTGHATVIGDPAEFKEAAALIAARSPRFKARLDKGEIGAETALVRIDPVELRTTDLAKGPGPNAVTVITLPDHTRN